MSGKGGKELEGLWKGFSRLFPEIFVALFRLGNKEYMHAQLLLKAFEKAQIDTGSEVVQRRAQHLSDEIQERSGQPYGERSLRNYFNQSQASDKNFDLPSYVVDALAGYLGFQSYREFLKAQGEEQIPVTSLGRRNLRLWLYPGLVLVLILGGWMLYTNPFQTKMMIWKEDHYEVVPMDLNKYKLSELKKINPERLEHFRKVQPDCAYNFFDAEGLELLWYGKNREGELEFFTDLGRHPETNKTLDPITAYMIKKYICPTYPN